MEFKSKEVRELFPNMHSILIMILADADWFMKKKGYSGIVLTESVTSLKHDLKVGRLSRSHREGRAGDIRTWIYKPDDVEALGEYLELKYGKYGAISFNSGKRNLFVYGDARHQDHAHIQIDAIFANKNLEQYASLILDD